MRLHGVETQRVSNVTYTLYGVQVENDTGSVKVDIAGSSIWSASPYVPNASRPYINITSPNATKWRDKQEVEHSGKLSLEQLVNSSYSLASTKNSDDGISTAVDPEKKAS